MYPPLLFGNWSSDTELSESVFLAHLYSKAGVTRHQTRYFNCETLTKSTYGALNDNAQSLVRGIFRRCMKYISSIILPLDPNILYAACTTDDLKENELVYNMVSGIQRAKRNSLERRILRCALAKTYSRRKVMDLLNGIHYGTRVNEESEEDSNADSDGNDERNGDLIRQNSIKKKAGILAPQAVQKRLRGGENDETPKTKRPKLCAGARRMYRTALSEWDLFMENGQFPKRTTNKAYFSEELIDDLSLIHI